MQKDLSHPAEQDPNGKEQFNSFNQNLLAMNKDAELMQALQSKHRNTMRLDWAKEGGPMCFKAS